jgi:hypothetical protein
MVNRILFFSAIISAGNVLHADPSQKLILDGYNAIQLDWEHQFQNDSTSSFIFGNPQDSIDQLITTEPIDSTTPAFSFEGLLTSEIGEEILNPRSTTARINRDHSDYGISRLYVPRCKSVLYSVYRYMDVCSDRFDNQWTAWSDAYKTPFPYAEKGLNNDVIGGYAMNAGQNRLFGSIRQFGQWGTTPVFFSPLYRKGTSLRQGITSKLGSADISTTASFSHYEEYPFQVTAVAHNDVSIDAHVSLPLKKGTGSTAQCVFNSTVNPAWYFTASLNDSTLRFLSWQIRGGMWQNKRPFGSVTLSSSILQPFILEAAAGWEYLPKHRDTPFRYLTNTVTYKASSLERGTFHAALRYPEGKKLPLSASIWYDFCEKPLWELVSFGNNEILIKQDTIPDALRSTVGMSTQYAFNIRKSKISVFGHVQFMPKKGIAKFWLPYTGGAEWQYPQNPTGNQPNAALTLEYRSQASQNYFNVQTRETFGTMAPARTALSAKASLPFISPIWQKHFFPVISLEAGPLYLSPSLFNGWNYDKQRLPLALWQCHRANGCPENIRRGTVITFWYAQQQDGPRARQDTNRVNDKRS